MQQYASALVATGLVLAMSASLTWQTADWLRLLRAPVASDAVVAQQLAPAASSQPLVDLFGDDGPVESALLPTSDPGLTLLGSFVHADGQRSSAIIRIEGRQAQRYQVGGVMANGTRLQAVYADHVELQRDGRRESLSFPHRPSPERAVPQTVNETDADAPEQLGERPADNLAQLRGRMSALREQMAAVGALPENAEPTDQPTESH